jgi:hypothetical protein
LLPIILALFLAACFVLLPCNAQSHQNVTERKCRRACLGSPALEALQSWDKVVLAATPCLGHRPSIHAGKGRMAVLR